MPSCKPFVQCFSHPVFLSCTSYCEFFSHIFPTNFSRGNRWNLLKHTNCFSSLKPEISTRKQVSIIYRRTVKPSSPRPSLLQQRVCTQPAWWFRESIRKFFACNTSGKRLRRQERPVAGLWRTCGCQLSSGELWKGGPFLQSSIVCVVYFWSAGTTAQWEDCKQACRRTGVPVPNDKEGQWC